MMDEERCLTVTRQKRKSEINNSGSIAKKPTARKEKQKQTVEDKMVEYVTPALKAFLTQTVRVIK